MGEKIMIKLNDKQIKHLQDLIGVTYNTNSEDAKRAAFDVCAVMDFLFVTAQEEEIEWTELPILKK